MIFLFGNTNYSQTRFSVPSTGLVGEHVIELDTCYIVSNRHNDNGIFKFMFHKLSKDGDSLTSWTHLADTHDGNHAYLQPGFTELNKSRYIVGRAYDTSDFILKGLVAKFNSDYSQTTNFFNFNFGASTTIDFITSKNANLIASAHVFQTNSKRFGSLLKLDTNGNILWRKDFKNHKHLWNFGVENILSTPDNGYLLKGWKLLNHLHYYQSIDSVVSYLIKVDSNGNEEWRLGIGNPKTANNISNPVLTSDNNYLVAWTDNYLNGLTHPFYELDPNDSNSFYIAKISSSGSVMWEKDLKSFLKRTDTAIGRLYSSGYNYNLMQMNNLKDGNISIIGNVVAQGFMLNLTQEGEPIWYRKYYPTQLPPLSDSNYGDNGLTGMIETSDNGFLLTSYTRVAQGVMPPWGVQTSYLYKVDNYGCLSPGCYKQDKWYLDSVQTAEDSVQAIKDSIADAINKSNKGSLVQLYPNPSNGNITVKIPASYSFDSPIQFSLYSSTGKLIEQVNLTDYTTEIDLSSLPKGMYLSKFQGEEFYETKKVVLQ